MYLGTYVSCCPGGFAEHGTSPLLTRGSVLFSIIDTRRNSTAVFRGGCACYKLLTRFNINNDVADERDLGIVFTVCEIRETRFRNAWNFLMLLRP